MGPPAPTTQPSLTKKAAMLRAEMPLWSHRSKLVPYLQKKTQQPPSYHNRPYTSHTSWRRATST